MEFVNTLETQMLCERHAMRRTANDDKTSAFPAQPKQRLPAGYLYSQKLMGVMSAY